MARAACIRQTSNPVEGRMAMRFIYATRPLPKLEFATADQLEAIPLHAEVLAVCDGAMTIRTNHSKTFDSLTDEEQLALDELIVTTQISEAALRNKMNSQSAPCLTWLRRLLNI
jgi:hypothetical protein